KAEKEFNRIFREKKKPTDILEIKVNKKINIIDLILKTKLIDSRSAASRLIDQNAIKIDDQIINDRKKEITPKKGAILQIGRKKFIKLI
ncbi:tyrosine--tRNA ligase, partial [Patescibacteria group bacterium]|nr:tyrosine--tRNA ligase [Patescibacteria group bacterium]